MPRDNLCVIMPVNLADLEHAIRNAIPVVHLEIQDHSSGCGENYAIVLVSSVHSISSYSHVIHADLDVLCRSSRESRH
jgi:stress-induced morphogen